MTDTKKILEQNQRRLDELFCPYDPVTGEGSLIDRFPFYIYKDQQEPIHLPASMKEEYEGVNLQVDAGSDFRNEMLRFHVNRLNNDFEFWALTCAKIKPKKGGNPIPFKLNLPQRILLKELIAMFVSGEPIRVIIVKARQWGGSTLVQIFMVWIQLVHKTNWNSVIVGDVEDQARNIRGMYSRLIDNYPAIYGKYKLSPFEGSTKNKIIDGRSNVISIGSMQKPESLRSADLAMCHLSEVAFWKKTEGKSPEDLIQNIMGTIPDDAMSLVAMESTAKGVGNFFHRTWLQALSGESNLNPVFIPWFKIENYTKQFDSLDEKIKFIETMNDYEWQLWEYGASIEGIHWYRFRFKAYGGDEWRMQSEFPSTCIEGNIRVGTNFGIVKIKDIEPGMICSDGKVLNKIYKGKKQTYILTTHKGYRLKCTDDHRILTTSGWRELRDISTDGTDIILSPPLFSNKAQYVDAGRIPCERSKIEITPELSRFIGIFMGDGSYSGNTLSIACDAKDEDFAYETKELVKSLFGIALNERWIGKNKGCLELRAGAKKLLHYFKSLGMVKKRESDQAHIRKVCVPEYIFKSPEFVIKEFLKGIFETDGFCGYGLPKIGLFSKHRKFLEDIQLLLLGFGITSLLRTRKAVNGKGYEYIANTLILQGEQADLYHEKIGFLSNRKISLFDSWEIKNRGKRTKNEFTDKVVSIEKDGICDVYDLTIENTHQFDAGGIKVHNCDEAFQATGRKVFAPDYVRTLKPNLRPPILKGDIFASDKEGKKAFMDLEIKATPNGELSVWSMPNTPALQENEVFKNGRYAVFVDIGGRSKKADYSVISVFDRYWMAKGGEPERVATWVGHIDQDLLAWKAAQIAKIYDNALLAFETNTYDKDKDTEGEHSFTVVDTIADYYDNMYTRTNPEDIKQGVPAKWGFHSNVNTKPMLIDNFNRLLRLNAEAGAGYVEYDERAYFEADYFEYKEDGKKTGAVEGQHDDIIITTMGALWLCTSYMDSPLIIKHDPSVVKTGSVKSAASF